MANGLSLRADAQRNRELVIRAAEQVFAERGIAVSLEQIAAAAGVGVGTLYRRFPHRDHLIAAVLESKLAELEERARQLLARPVDRAGLRSFLTAYLQHASRYRGLAASLSEAAAEPGSPLALVCKQMQSAAEQLVTTAQQRGLLRADLAAPDLLAMTASLGLVVEAAPEKEQPLLTVLLDGFAHP